jgi:hypothetical protein
MLIQSVPLNKCPPNGLPKCCYRTCKQPNSVRDDLKLLISAGKRQARKLKRAHILHGGRRQSRRRGHCRQRGGRRLDRLSNQAPLCTRQPRGGPQRRAATRGASRKLSGKGEALAMAAVCSGPPTRRARWMLDCWPMNWFGLPGSAAFPAKRRVGDWRNQLDCPPRPDLSAC